MKLDELNGKYEHLRSELDAAYADPVWDSERIDRITQEMIPIERALTSFQAAQSDTSGAHHV